MRATCQFRQGTSRALAGIGRLLIALFLLVGFSLFTAGAARANLPIAEFTTTASATDSRVDPAQAGAHADLATSIKIATDPVTFRPLEDVRTLTIRLPPGVLGNPQGAPMCTPAQFFSSNPNVEGCPANTQVGEGAVTISPGGGFTNTIPAFVYNLVPAPGQTAVLAVHFAGGVSSPQGFQIVNVSARTDSDFGLTAVSSNVQRIAVKEIFLKLWGIPGEHNRGKGAGMIGPDPEGQRKPFMNNPVNCQPAPETTLQADSYQHPGEFVTAIAPATDPVSGLPAPVTGCMNVPFDPSLAVQPDSTAADKPAGYKIDVNVPQDLTPYPPGGVQTSYVRRVEVTLPTGVSINPSVGSNGLEGCADAQIGLGNNDPVTCPIGSKLGDLSIQTPIFTDAIQGAVYFANPTPSDPYRIYLVASGHGLLIKLAGSIHPDPQTGQLTTVFKDLPQVPFTQFELRFRGGDTAALANPPTCGPATSTARFTPWSGGPDKVVSSSFNVSADGNGAPCPSPQPFAPAATVITPSPYAGSDASFGLRFDRADGQQPLTGISASLPPGVLGKVAAVPLCAAAQAAAGACGDASKVGEVLTAAGPGGSPVVLKGKVFLAQGFGPYPFALSVVVPAVVGPVNLGNVVVRVGIRVRPSDSGLDVVSDPLPTILQGIPLRLRSVTLVLNRPGFQVNPTNCGVLPITATLGSAFGALMTSTPTIQANSCSLLGFNPQMTASSSAITSNTIGASLHVHISQGAGEANIKSVAVTLPKQTAARLTTLNGACPQANFDAGTCSPNSQVGTSTATTPVLNLALAGPAYIVSHGGGALPTINVQLFGQGVGINLIGTIVLNPDGTTSSTFGAVPDVPITSFDLDLPTGPHSALSATSDLCAAPLAMPAVLTGQNGARIQRYLTVKVTDCKPPPRVMRSRCTKPAKANVSASTPGAAGQAKAKHRGKGKSNKTKKKTCPKPKHKKHRAKKK